MVGFVPASIKVASLTISAIYASARNPLQSSQITAFVPFGDSYTDTFSPSNGGTAWPVYAVSYAGKDVGLFPFARSGATCSNNITDRPFPSLFESQLPLCIVFPVDWDERYRDNGLLTGHGAPGVSLVDVAGCMVNWVKVVYESGARNFIFANMIPLQQTPLYSPNSYTNHYWTAVRNTTEWNVVMNELVLSGNELTRLMLQALVPTLRGAHLGIFDTHELFSEMLDRPSLYLNGTAPLNTTGAVKSCVYQLNEPTSDTGVCTIAQGVIETASYGEYDELHPSEQADRIVAREVAKVINGEESEWMDWLM
ncbi:GDSL lipase/acylhydrolase [Flammula alnicola]|nr:GDSL lipase/acylhydrolase [Flammula alnicola]